MFARSGSALFRTRRFRWHLFRNLMHFVGVAGWFYAISQINLSVGMSLQFTVPLFTIVLAIMFLGERVDTARWIATFLGFAGVLIILRPGLEPVTMAAVAAIVSAAGYAGANIATKVLMRDGTSDTIVFYMNVIHLPLALIAAWAMGGISLPSIGDVPWLIGLAASATLAHWLLARALALADASLIIIVDFTKLPWVTLGAFVFSGKSPWSGHGSAGRLSLSLLSTSSVGKLAPRRRPPRRSTDPGKRIPNRWQTPPRRLINRPITRFSPPAGYWERLLPSF